MRAEEKGLQLCLDQSSEFPRFVRADAGKLRQVPINLVGNAVKYTEPGGRVEVSLTEQDGKVICEVEDTGVGIPAEDIPRIFERFYRADPSRSRAEGGTGLGLAIVRHTVEAHGGRVWAESHLGEGTTISCWFPAAEPEGVTEL